jgi:truncated hemoglobin YjbI
MRKKLVVAGAGLLLAASVASAQTPYTNDSVYRGLGGQQGIHNIVETFMSLVLADPRIKDGFADFDIPELKKRLGEQFCEIAGGSCKYTGKYKDRDMKSVHEDLKINDFQFNALAEDLQIAMERQNVPASVSNKLIARLAPMHRDIVTVRTPAERMPEMGKFIATGGVSQVEGAGGGGIVPWALITGYGTRDSWGANAHYTYVKTQDYSLKTYGVAVGLYDRVELSVAQQQFEGELAPLDQLSIKQEIFGVKVRVAGNAVYDQDSWLPQIAVGAMYKKNKGIDGLAALGVTSVKQLGARDDKGYDFYVAATKVLFEQSLLVSGTLRATRANQMGLLGFGGDLHASRRVQPEISAAYLVTRQLAAGVEWRRKPHNLGVDDEKNYYDAFVAWFPNRNLSLTAAYANLGDITIFNPKQQKGVYLSAQVGF